ncbi:MAG: aspartate/glutamate racemase family protein [Kordiimonas sp.]
MSSKHIGIVGCSAEGAALCFQTLCMEGAEYGGKHWHPEISMHTPPLTDYMEYIDRDDWAGVGDVMLRSAQKLADIGADFVICPDNTIHQALHYIEDRLPVPWLHIADAVVAQAKECGYKRIGLTGTKWLVNSSVYPERIEAAGLEYVRPTEDEREKINSIIMDELVPGVFRPEAVTYFQKVIDGLKEQGCDAVILGCTEIPLIINDDNSSLPTLDSTRLLARAALRRAIA